ncbi:MAG: tRNA dihydrouridine synthase DusB [Desulfobacterales bacterium]|nr:tRNA dihydrouridine synthase DusB [Desulfobacterales bacterium]
MKIGDLSLGSPFVLAPLAGYTDLPFRLLCREYGAGLCFSEMISCHGLVFGQKNTLAMLATVEAERPVAFQLFGAEPEIMGKAAAILSDLPIDMIDINMGCPVKKVTRKGAGAALMRNPKLAAKIISAVRANSRLPISVKIRSGCNESMKTAPDFARMAEDAGARLVTIHGRTWSQGFSGRADWRIIAAVKQAVSIPVIGNGDIHCRQDGLAMIEQTGCDGVMVGRAALGNPWIFSSRDRPDTLSLRLSGLHRHLELAARYLDVDRKLAGLKNHAGRYLKEIPKSAGMRRRIYGARSFAELLELSAPCGRLASG